MEKDVAHEVSRGWESCGLLVDGWEWGVSREGCEGKKVGRQEGGKEGEELEVSVGIGLMW
ncbi:hypothetical protein [Planctopirus hydrillae]|uniref:Uncharacterized protein n=1 Tax=Planctopirus hydrillae TaxID=1841610 RepID=A0A1C3E9Y8_9PLAN|nr:hypothetical protein [Planctopirus hydrillae]ODA30019.1 hypothetical protein A6X21_06685 [Planctopirus hydrillae]